MELAPGNAQWIGTRREQQDAFGFHGFGQDRFRRHAGVLVVLADGMGGMSRGREASHLAVERLMAAYGEKLPEEPIPEALARALAAANRAVYERAGATEGVGQVGTTLVAAVVWEQELYWVAVGDSRLYLWRAQDGALIQCTQDHNVGADLGRQVAAGALDREQVLRHPDRGVLTSFVGMAEIPQVDGNPRPLVLVPGDKLLLCSDGVYDVLSDAELRQALAKPAEAAAEALMAAVRRQALAEQDNATVALLECRADPALPAVAPRPAGRRAKIGLLGIVLVLVIGVWLGWTLARFASEPGVPVAPVRDGSVAPPDRPPPGAAAGEAPPSSPPGGAADEALPPDPWRNDR
jgi:protein phosphatase